MKRYLIHVGTNWVGTDNTYRIEAESEDDLDSMAYDLSYDNFLCYCSVTDIAEAEGLDTEDPDVLEQCEEKIEDYISWDVEEFNGTEEEWNGYEWCN